MLRRYCEALERGERPDFETEQFLKAAFLAIRQGTPPKKALQLERGRGRKSAKTLREMIPQADMAMRVMRRMRAGVSYEKAIELVADETRLSYKTVQRHYGKAKAPAALIIRLYEQLPTLLQKLAARSKNQKVRRPLDKK